MEQDLLAGDVCLEIHLVLSGEIKLAASCLILSIVYILLETLPDMEDESRNIVVHCCQHFWGESIVPVLGVVCQAKGQDL